ncbi:PP2C family protein-serine/threonine phosphatase [Leeia oryzae]|uniref:PP2C family protein-serine/threonine phosphatase n=1 Tax=Leeia oryzae TaxID=356662 RepID=UPI000376BB36|nr:protein phosphatase 2C domain-containing protein [Leeia oryzae]
MKFSIYQESRRGGRKYNQDRMGYSYSRDALLLVIADGMGGHLQGEIAAQIAVEMLIRQFEAAAKPVIKEPTAFMYEAIHQAHEAILDYTRKNQLLESPRTTIVTCIVQGNMAYWAHVGDSRLYFFHKGVQQHVTTDHSRVQQLIQMGKITPEQAMTHPDRNKIYNCLGSAFPPEVELSPRRPITNGDTILLCTDGLWGTLDPAELQQYLGQFPVLYALPQLMDKAEFNGGKFGDNLTALGITWLEEDDLSQSTATSTLKMSANDVNSQLDTIRVDDDLKSSGEVTDEDIEKAIAEIQNAIKRYTN